MAHDLVVLCSGGLDSTTLLGLSLTQYDPRSVLALSILYGQKHDKEIEAARQVTGYYKVDHRVIRIPPTILEGSSSTLIDPNQPQPKMTYQEITSTFGVSPTYVPNRNALLISLAGAVAKIENGDYVWIGVHAEDSRNWAYPDCTPEFVGAMANALYVGTYHSVRLAAPFQYLMKKDIVGIGLSLGVPYHLTWTCYDGREVPCGTCPSCVERAEAFKENGMADPLLVQGGPSKPSQLELELEDTDENK